MKFLILLCVVLRTSYACNAQQPKITVDTLEFYSGNLREVTYRTNSNIDKKLYFDSLWNLTSEINYIEKKGYLTGRYYKKNTLSMVIHYINGYRNGEFTSYYDSGEIRWIGFYEDDLKTGTWTTFYKNKSKLAESSYSRNKLHGKISEYYQNGNVKYSGEYRRGRMYGERLLFEENGQLKNGEFEIFTSPDSIKKTGFCINGKPEGELKLYSQDGNLSLIANFKNGLPDGITRHFGKNQEVIKIEEYKAGKFLREIKIKD